MINTGMMHLQVELGCREDIKVVFRILLICLEKCLEEIMAVEFLIVSLGDILHAMNVLIEDQTYDTI